VSTLYQTSVRHLNIGLKSGQFQCV